HARNSPVLTRCIKYRTVLKWHKNRPSNRATARWSILMISIDADQHPPRRHAQNIRQALQLLHAARSQYGLHDQLLGKDRPDGHARSAFRHVDYCEDQPERLRDNQRSPEPGVLTPLATWTLLSCLFRLFLRSRSIWSKGSLWGGFWRFRQYDGTFVRNDKSFVFSRVLHKGLIIFFALEFLPIASQLQ